MACVNDYLCTHKYFCDMNIRYMFSGMLSNVLTSFIVHKYRANDSLLSMAVQSNYNTYCFLQNAHYRHPIYIRDWSRSRGSFGNNTQVICCPAPGCPESTALATSPPNNKARGCCCHNYRPTVINPDYNMTKQFYIKCFYDKIRSKSPKKIERHRLLASIVKSGISP